MKGRNLLLLVVGAAIVAYYWKKHRAVATSANNFAQTTVSPAMALNDGSLSIPDNNQVVSNFVDLASMQDGQTGAVF